VDFHRQPCVAAPLGEHGEAAIGIIACSCHDAHRHFALEHQGERLPQRRPIFA
jgi:hypothetical protein